MDSTKSPVSEYLFKLQMIVSNTTFKNKVEAEKYETLEMSKAANAYLAAVNNTDIFSSYTYSQDEVVTVLLQHNKTPEQIQFMLQHPHTMSIDIQRELMKPHHDAVIENYKEHNRYYLNLMGLPYLEGRDGQNDPVIRIPDEFYLRYSSYPELSPGTPVYELSPEFQEIYINSEFYQQALDKYPHLDYLRHIGSNSIPLTVSRPTKDGHIMNINTTKLSTYHPSFGVVNVTSDIVHKFTQVYGEVHNYVFHTLRGDFEQIYANYDEFIRFLTIYLTIGNCMNEFMKESASLIHMNQITADNLFNLYGLPSVIMEGSSMIDFLKKFRLLLMDKGTRSVYRVKDLIGYEYTDIYSLIMVKQQIFAETGDPMYIVVDGKSVPRQNIVFRRIGTTADANSYFRFKMEKDELLERRFPPVEDDSDERQVSSGDPRWWESQEVNDALRDMNYTLSNSKYIQLSTHLSYADIWWQSVILLRGLLDQKLQTDSQRISINFNVNGSTDLSVFDTVLCLVIIMNHQMGFRGDMYYSNIDKLFNGLYEDLTPKPLIDGGKFKIASFNFDVKKMTDPDWYSTINNQTYLEPSRFKPMVDSVLENKTKNVGETLMVDIKLIYDYLKDKLLKSTCIAEYRQVADAYNALFLVDPVREWGTASSVAETICREYNISLFDYEGLCSFFDERQITDTSSNADIHVAYKGNLYPIWLHDVMNQDVKSIFVSKTSDQPEGGYYFNDPEFVNAFDKAMNDFKSYGLEHSTLPLNVRQYYRQIIETKVELDLISSEEGMSTFMGLLHEKNPLLAKYVTSLINEGNKDTLILFLRSLIKGLDTYTSSNLGALEFRALGQERYISILKEVISYFKSYMVEFTKDEFIIMIDNILDNGGNPNTFRLYDEFNHKTLTYRPIDSLAMFDASRNLIHTHHVDDNNVGFLRDEAIIRLKMPYATLLAKGLEVWYDDGVKITRTPFTGLTNDTIVIANIVHKSPSTYRAILHKSNINPDNYYGNKRKINE